MLLDRPSSRKRRSFLQRDLFPILPSIATATPRKHGRAHSRKCLLHTEAGTDDGATALCCHRRRPPHGSRNPHVLTFETIVAARRTKLGRNLRKKALSRLNRRPQFSIEIGNCENRRTVHIHSRTCSRRISGYAHPGTLRPSVALANRLPSLPQSDRAIPIFAALHRSSRMTLSASLARSTVAVRMSKRSRTVRGRIEV